MRRKIEKKKIVVSISVDYEIFDTINETIPNRSKFLEQCIISELCKSSTMKEELKKKFIIL